MKNVLFIGNYYPESWEKDIVLSTTGGGVHFSSSHYNRKVITGFDKNEFNLIILTAPIIGKYPKETTINFFNMGKDENNIFYCHYNNRPLIRNYSRSKALVKKAREIIKQFNIDYIVVSEIHLPFLRALKQLNKKKSIKTTLLVLDLPEFSNLEAKKSLPYRLLKRIYNRKVYHLIQKYVSNFVFLSEQMNTKQINPTNKPYIVSETIIESINHIQTRPLNDNKIVLYSGSLHYAFGIKILLEAFLKSNDKYKLIIAGSGEASEEIKSISLSNPNLVFLGLLTQEELKAQIENADVCVNPRQAIHDFSKYSFPSKIGEYLSYKKIIVSFNLPSYPEKIKKCLLISEKEDPVSLNKKVEYALNISKNQNKTIQRRIDSVLDEYSPYTLVKRIQQQLWERK